MKNEVIPSKPPTAMNHSETEDDLRMTFTEHLGELRTRIMISGAAVVISFFVCYAFSEQLFFLVTRPLQPHVEAPITLPTGDSGTEQAAGDAAAKNEIEWVQLNFMEAFLVYLKLAAYFGILLSLPIIIHQICAFIFPGLKPSERRAVRIMLTGGSVLALAGTAVAYLFVFPIVLQYLLRWAPESINITLRMNENVGLLIKGYFGFAIAFQFPMVVLVLVYLDLLTPATLRQHRKFAIVGIAVASAIFTPPEPMSMIIMMIPLYLMYEISIWVSYLVVRRRNAAA